MRARLWLVAALIAPALHASELVYRPVNPSFGGNPLNSSHLLGTANAQNDYKDPASGSGSSGTSALDCTSTGSASSAEVSSSNRPPGSALSGKAASHPPKQSVFSKMVTL